MKYFLALIIAVSLVCSAQAQQGIVIGPPALRSKIISANKDMTQASGNVSYTGFGFQPTSCMVTASLGTVNLSTGNFAYGFSDSSLTSSGTFFFNSQANATSVNLLTLTDATVTNAQVATVASYDTDGLTLTWVKSGSPTGTVTVKFLCFR